MLCGRIELVLIIRFKGSGGFKFKGYISAAGRKERILHKRIIRDFLMLFSYDFKSYKCQDKYAQKFSYKYVQFILLSILSRFLGKGAEADKIFLLL